MKLKIVNKIVVVFMLIVFGAIFMAWQFLHSELFGDVLSKNINKFISKEFDNKIAIRKFNLKLFPPGIVAKDALIDFEQNGFTVGGVAKELDITFSIFHTQRNLIKIKKIGINDAIINLNSLTKKESKEKKTEEFALKELPSSKFNNIQLNRVELNKVRINFNGREFYVNKVDIKALKENYKIYSNVEVIGIPKVDSLELKGILDAKKLNVDYLRLYSNRSKLELKGEVRNILQKLSSMKLNLKGNLNSELSDYSDLKALQDIDLILKDGRAQGKLNISGLLLNPKVELDLTGDKPSLSYCVLDKLSAKVEYLNQKLIIKDFLVNHDDGSLAFKKMELFDFKKMDFIYGTTQLKVNNLKIGSALKYMQDSLYPLKGRLNGKMIFSLNKDGVSFTTKENFLVKDFKLQFDSTPTLASPEVNISDSVFAIKNYIFYTTTKMRTLNSTIELEGEVNETKLYFNALNSTINFSDFGKIAGLDMYGNGNVDFIADGPLDDVTLKMNMDLKDVSIEEYVVGKPKGLLNFSFKDSIIEFKDVESKVGSTKFFIKGIFNYDTLFIDLDTNFPHSNYNDLKVIHTPLLNNETLPESITGNMNVSYKVQNIGSLDNIKVNGKFLGENNTVYSENLRNTQYDFSYHKNILSFEDIVVKKANGSILGEYVYDLKSTLFKLKLKSRSLKLSDFTNYNNLPSTLSSDIDFDISLNLLNKSEDSYSQLSFKNSYVKSKRLPNSKFDFIYSDDSLVFTGNLFGKRVELDSDIYLKDQKRSNFDIEFNVIDLDTFLVAFLGIHTKGQRAKGRLRSTISSDFLISEFDKMNLELVIGDLFLEKDNLYIVNSAKQRILINNGDIKPFDIKMVGRNAELSAKGKGNLYKKFDIDIEANYDATLIELLSPKIVKSSGFIKNHAKISSKGINTYYHLITQSNNLKLSIEDFPADIKNADYRISFTNKNIEFEKLKVNLSQGEVDINGGIQLLFPYPSVNVNFNLNKAEIYPFIKSSMLISGVGNLLGEKLPYSVVGDLNIERGRISTELSDLEDSSSLAKFSNSYFPKIVQSKVDSIVKMDVNLSSSSPIFVQNSIIDAGLVGDLKLSGNIFDPTFDGALSFIPGLGKVFFKNNEFIIGKGEIIFDPDKTLTNPNIDVETSLVLNEYKIRMHVLGDVENYNVDLSSEPNLSPNDIFSMIAFGYTEDVSKNLSDVDRSNLSSAGIGSILFSQFKITNALKQSFGVQLNLGTEFEQDASNLLGQNEGAGSQVGRVRSATKIELKKQLMNKIGLAVSQTVGGSIGQKQSVNLNYKVNDNVSLELVQEKRSNDDNDEQVNDESIGADVRFRYSY